MNIKSKVMIKDLVKIEWDDACTYDERVKINFEFDSIPVVTIGRILKKNKNKIIVYRDLYDYGDKKEIDGVIAIPRGSIRKITKLQ